MSTGSSARSVTSVTPSVKLDSHAPVAPTRSGSCAIMRCDAFFAFSTLSPASKTTSFSLAPPSALMPPCPLMSSMARLAPLSMRSPWRAHGPDIGAISPILISVWAAAGATSASASAPPANAFQVLMTSSRFLSLDGRIIHECVRRSSGENGSDGRSGHGQAPADGRLTARARWRSRASAAAGDGT